MLRAVHSNRVEALLSTLLEALPPADPFAPSTIVVGSLVVARWLSREIAFARGIAAGLDLVTFDAFVERTWASDTRGTLGSVDRRQLAAAIASVLADHGIVSDHEPVEAYLDAAPAPGDRAGPRRVQLAEHLAELAWSYALSRPDWMPALAAGQVPSELAGERAAPSASSARPASERTTIERAEPSERTTIDPTARWQAALLGTALDQLRRGTTQRAPTPMLPWLRRRAGFAPPRLAAPIAVFGMSFLARAQLEALTNLATTTDVTIYVLDPCEELWDDVAGRGGRDGATGDPLPLILWGRPVRDTLGALVERTGGDLEGRFVAAAAGTARAQLLADVQVRRAPEVTEAFADAGVRVLACPNARREIEVVAAEARRRLEADPTLHAHEIGVWIAGEADRYLAQAPSAFDAVGVPCHLIDAPLDDRGRIGEAVVALLELPTSEMTRRDLLRVMTHPAVLAGYPHVDADDWVRWTERLGIARGASDAAHANTYLAEHPGQFHWDQGVRRLALGAFMVGERSERGPARVASFEVAPEELRPEQQASAATYALLVRSLCADAAWLGAQHQPLTVWADVLVALVDHYLAPRDQDATRDHERVRAMLAAIARDDLDGRPVGFREVREHAARRLAAARTNRGEPLAAGVMIAPLAALRAVPFRVTFVVGLDEGAFPASDRTSPLDLRREPRIGDVAPRDRDRAAFLDVLLCARDALYLSYVATEAKSGQPLAPSSVVLELADALAPYVGAASSRDALAQITEHFPLHRHSGDAPALLPAVARERWACGIRDALRDHLRAAGHPIPDEDGQLALLAHPSQVALRAALGVVEPPPHVAQPAATRPVTIANLRGFLEYPIQAWAQAVLGLDELPDDETAEQTDEPFHLDKPDRVVLLREVFAASLRDPRIGLETRYDAAVRDRRLRGQFPVGVFASAARCLDLRVLETWRSLVGPIALGSATRYGFGRAHSPGAELLPALALPLGDGRTVQLVGQTELLVRGAQPCSIVPILRKLEKKSPYHLRGAFDHVVLAAAGLANAGYVHRLIDDQGSACEVTHDPWSIDDARGYLAGLVRELLDAPHGYLLPFEALAKALGGGGGRSWSGRPTDLTGGLGYGPIDRPDGLDPPPDAAAIAHRRLKPLVARMHGEHGFEVAA